MSRLWELQETEWAVRAEVAAAAGSPATVPRATSRPRSQPAAAPRCVGVRFASSEWQAWDLASLVARRHRHTHPMFDPAAPAGTALQGLLDELLARVFETLDFTALAMVVPRVCRQICAGVAVPTTLDTGLAGGAARSLDAVTLATVLRRFHGARGLRLFGVTAVTGPGLAGLLATAPQHRLLEQLNLTYCTQLAADGGSTG